MSAARRRARARAGVAGSAGSEFTANVLDQLAAAVAARSKRGGRP